MPSLTVATDARPGSATPRGRSATSRRGSTSSRTSSPPRRPPISPITPTLGPTRSPGASAAAMANNNNDNSNDSSAVPDFALGRPVFIHSTQIDQVSIAPPPAQPIDFDSNPDALALKSAISILQLQRARATADIQSLSRAKDAALANPEAFVADLGAGRVRMEGDPLLSDTRGSNDSASDSDSNSDDGDDGDQGQCDGRGETPEPEINGPETDGAEGDSSKAQRQPSASRREGKYTPGTTITGSASNSASPPRAKPSPWHKLPKPQTVVRCPPINWAQYGVVGESLDKLHAEQLAAPTPGAPLVLGQGGTYEFKAGGGGGGQAASVAGATAAGGVSGSGGGSRSGIEQQPRRLVGVAAPYNPMRDKLEKKAKGAKR